jgi:Flp pilus assembly pilin Flp
MTGWTHSLAAWAWATRRIEMLRERVGLGTDPAEGLSIVEYGIVIGLIAVVAMAAIQALGGGVTQVFSHILARLQGIG